MKLLIYIINIMLVFEFSLSQEEFFDFIERPLNVSLNGAVKINETIIAYGDNSSYLISKDNGKSWDQKYINIKDEIIKIYRNQTKLFGFTYYGNKIESIDFGDTWTVSKLNSINKINDFRFDGYSIFILDSNSISVLDSNLNVINQYYDSNIVHKQSINFDFFVYNYRLVITKDNIFYENSNPGKLSYFNKEDFKKGISQKNEIVICDSCKNRIANIVKCKDSLYFQIYMNTISNNKTNLFYALNINDFKFKEIQKSYFPNGSIFEVDNALYQLFNVDGYISNNSRFSLVSKIFNNDNFTFDSIGRTKAIPSDLSNLRGFDKVDDTTYIATSSSKSIFISRDKCKTWEIVSSVPLFYYYNPIYIRDSMEISKKGGFESFTSNNYGITHKPSEYMYDSINYFKDYKARITYANKYGNIVTFNSNWDPHEANAFLSNDFGKSYSPFHIDINSYIDAEHNFLSKFNNQYISIFNTSSQGINYIVYCKFDSLFKLLTPKKNGEIESHNEGAFFDDENKGIVINTKVVNDTAKLILKETIDGFKTWKNINEKVVNYSKLNFYSLDKNNDTLLFISYKKISFSQVDTVISKVFLFIRSSNTFIDIYENYSLNYPFLYFDFGKKKFIGGYNTFIEPDGSFLKWKSTIYNDGRNFLFSFKTDNDEPTYIVKYTSPNYAQKYYKVKLKSKTSVSSQTEDQTYFYSYPPYPIPAMNEVKSLIYWDMNYNIDDSDIGVYDIYGNIIADREKISVNKLNSYSGYLTWDCSGIATGVYMIQIKYGTNTHNIRAMVVK